MASATILFCDIVSFSKKPTDFQKVLIESLTSEVLYHVRKDLFKPFNTTDLIVLPTGDGMAIAFIHSEGKLWDVESILTLSFKLHIWAFNQSKNNSDVKMRVGIHVGDVEFLVDINGKTNICGDSINYAQRVMDAANPGQILISETAFRHYFNLSPIDRIINISNIPYSVHPSSPIETYAKHGLRMLVHSLLLNNDNDWYDNSEPYSKNIMLLSTTPLPKEIIGSFSDSLSTAKEIALLQLTGERLLKKIQNNEIQFSENLKTLYVIMPDSSSFNKEYYKSIVTGSDDIEKLLSDWEIALKGIHKKASHIDVRLITFKEPPYIGASFIDWNNPGGKIHVSPYIWNVKASECPGYDIFWLGQVQPAIYKAYVTGLDYLIKNGTRVF